MAFEFPEKARNGDREQGLGNRIREKLKIWRFRAMRR
jgi:hypothetical protein